MRDIGKGIEDSKNRVMLLKDMPLIIKVNEGRGKSCMYGGCITAVFPAVFTVRLDTGELKTFSYADVHTKGVMFLKK